MKAKCVSNRAESLDDRNIKAGYTRSSMLHLDEGTEYVVQAMALWNGMLRILVFDRTDLPNWYPTELFVISDPALPPDWFATTFVGQELQAIWGYREMVMNDDHHDAIIERDPAALAIIRRYRERE